MRLDPAAQIVHCGQAIGGRSVLLDQPLRHESMVFLRLRELSPGLVQTVRYIPGTAGQLGQLPPVAGDLGLHLLDALPLMRNRGFTRGDAFAVTLPDGVHVLEPPRRGTPTRFPIPAHALRRP